MFANFTSRSFTRAAPTFVFNLRYFWPHKGILNFWLFETLIGMSLNILLCSLWGLKRRCILLIMTFNWAREGWYVILRLSLSSFSFFLWMSSRVVCFAATQHHNSLISSPKLVNTLVTSNFLTPPQKHIFFTLFNNHPRTLPPPGLKIGIQGNNLNIFLWRLKTQIKKTVCFFWNLKILRFSMRKKLTPKSQAKTKPPFLQFLFLTIFDPKIVSCEQIYDFKS